MSRKLQEIGLGMNHEEFISVGKYWLWMTVFSTCLFASCGETNHPHQEPGMPASKAQAVPVKNVVHGEIPEEGISLEPHGYEEISESDNFDSDLEQFEDDNTLSEELEEIRDPESEGESREVRSLPEPQVETLDTQTEIALRETQDSVDSNEPKTSLGGSPPASSKAPDNTDAQAKWIAQFQVTGDSDDFAPDSPDEFESDSADEFGSNTSLSVD